MSESASSKRRVCLHGHFYQPPREDPWSGRIERQLSAAPFHDWNERIMRECYEPNAFARILLGENQVERLFNNYSRISFNFGPTLFSWLQEHAPKTYDAIIEADRVSQTRFSGHGSALAQAYSHMILPLANLRDKRTQVRWGLRDFEHRFGRPAEGMWLPECAVDKETLGVLVEEGVRYTILSPAQAKGTAHIRRPVTVDAGAGRTIAVFFYDAELARGIAFNGLLNNGAEFASRIRAEFSEDNDVQLVHTATDGESYGHHHRYGEMALAYALEAMESSSDIRLTNYGEFLELSPPRESAEIHEPSSWSCAHGVERWSSDCGCSNGSGEGFNQSWRTPLRTALDHLRDKAAQAFETHTAPFLLDPWGARDNYVDVLLKRTTPEDFVLTHGREGLLPKERHTAAGFLEMQYFAQLMYTSCGWFFDDVSRIETAQILRYAGKVIEMGRLHAGEEWEKEFLELLADAQSNVADRGTGADIYLQSLPPSENTASK